MNTIRVVVVMVTFFVFGCAKNATIVYRDVYSGNIFEVDNTKPPNGTQMMQILLGNLEVPLANTKCRNNDKIGESRTLRERMAMALGEDLEYGKTVLSGKCSTVPVQLSGESAWSCSLGFVYEREGAEENAVYSIDFVVKQNDWSIVPEHLFCL